MRRHFITRERRAWVYWAWVCILFFVALQIGEAEETLEAIPRPFSDVVYLTILLLPFMPLLGFAFRAYSRHLLKKRSVLLKDYAAKSGYELYETARARDYFKGMALRDLMNANSHKLLHLVKGDDWVYGDWAFNAAYKPLGRTYTTGRVFYGIMSTTLPRRLPHVFFDSHKARRRQFRLHFSRKQRHILEGRFEQHFDTYFPSGYTIDAMSIISPDVMWALQQAEDYDIEIVGNQLILYGPLYDPAAQIPDMAAKIARIKKELLDNILAYRDQNLPYNEGRQKVAPLGAKLSPSLFWPVVYMIVGILYTIAYILKAFLDN